MSAGYAPFIVKGRYFYSSDPRFREEELWCSQYHFQEYSVPEEWNERQNPHGRHLYGFPTYVGVAGGMGHRYLSHPRRSGKDLESVLGMVRLDVQLIDVGFYTQTPRRLTAEVSRNPRFRNR